MTTLNPSSEEIRRLQEASEWVQRLSGSDATDRVEAWMKWCDQDDRNLAAFERIQQVWMGLDSAPAAKRPRRRYAVALAASVLVLVGASGWLLAQYTQTQNFDTAAGLKIQETLSDGSHVDLAPGSRLRAKVSWLRRELWLDRGEAYFVVPGGGRRPLVVHANDLIATASGAAFDIRTGSQETALTVSEGRVAVVPRAGSPGAGPASDAEPLRAGVGQQVTASRAAPALLVASVDPEGSASWRDGVLQFIGKPLPQVAGELNRFIPQRIVVSSALQGTRFTGTVSTRRVQDWLDALKQIYSVEIVQENVNGIRISPRNN